MNCFSDNVSLLNNNEHNFAKLAYRKLQEASSRDTNDSDSELIHSLSLSRDKEILIKLSCLIFSRYLKGAIEIEGNLNEKEGE